jgi:hypothetical protein
MTAVSTGKCQQRVRYGLTELDRCTYVRQEWVQRHPPVERISLHDRDPCDFPRLQNVSPPRLPGRGNAYRQRA